MFSTNYHGELLYYMHLMGNRIIKYTKVPPYEHTHFCREIRNITFRKWGGGQRPFGTFPKIHPIWKRGASLSCKQKVYSRARYTTLKDDKWKKFQKFWKNISNNVWKLSSSDLPLLEMKQPVKWGLKWADIAERSFEENFIKCQNRRGTKKWRRRKTWNGNY